MKKFTLLCAAFAAAVGMNAQDLVPLTLDMWHQWEGITADDTFWGPNTKIVEEPNQEFKCNYGEESDFVIGNPGCNGNCYADLTEYAGVEGKGTSENGKVRFFFNREDMQGAGLDEYVQIEEDGTFKYEFSKLPGHPAYVHLNFVKFQWGTKGNIEYINLIPKNGDDPVVPVDPLAITGDWFHEWNGFGADAEIKIENPQGIENNIGKDLECGATLLGNAGVPGCVYADLTDYDGIEAEGTPGVSLRLLFNRPSMEGGSAPITECNPVFDEDGKFTFMFSEIAKKEGDNAYPYVHLNTVKTPAAWAGGYPEGISVAKVTKFNVIPKAGSAVKAIENAEADAVIYNIYGQRVDESYRGIVIKNGKKYINK
ncbi:MAG: hypothetical protein K2H49_03450 [Muribaculaceae bacterium]|nr:hypothetical protein [Muribaculaceae bacterium]